jgi:hypothetical protein
MIFHKFFFNPKHFKQLLNKHRENEIKTSTSLPVLPLPVIDSNQIRVLVDTKDPTENICPPVSEASHVTFNDDEVHHAKYVCHLTILKIIINNGMVVLHRWANMEEKLVQSAFGTTHAMFRPTNLLFSNTTNNTAHLQTYCDGKRN